VINQMQVSLADPSSISDEALAQVVRFALDHAALLAPGSVNVTVEDGVVALSGELAWDYQRREALRAAGAQRGVREVLDRISLKPPTAGLADSEAIINALRRNAMFDAEWITVEAYKGCVILRGSVRSWYERKWAERIAWCAQGTSEVINQLSVAG
jgi:osmotically-inducible protein OsmY